MSPSRPPHAVLILALLVLGLVLACAPAQARKPVELSHSLSPSPLPPTQSRPVIHLIFVAGQSNSVGYNTDGVTAEDAINPRILQLVVCHNATTALPPAQCYLNVSAEPLIPCQGGRVSAWRSFARALLPTLPQDDLVVLVSTGLGGTGFRDGSAFQHGSGVLPCVVSTRTSRLVSVPCPLPW